MVTHSEKVASYSSRVVKIADGQIIEDNKFKDNEINSLDELSISTTKNSKTKQNLSFMSALKLSAQNIKQRCKNNICTRSFFNWTIKRYNWVNRSLCNINICKQSFNSYVWYASNEYNSLVCFSRNFNKYNR